MTSSRKKRLNKILKRRSKALRKFNNPLDKAGRFSVESTEIAAQVVTDALNQSRDELDRLLNVTADRMDDVRGDKKIKDSLHEQLKRNPEEMRKVLEYSRKALDIVADGVVDIMDDASTNYDLYEAERDERKTAKKAGKKAKSK